MRSRKTACVAGVVAAGALLFAPTALAATEVGSNCAADEGGPVAFTALSLSSQANPLPVAVPTAGVVTRWRTNIGVPIPPGIISESLQVLRPAGGPNQFQLVGQSSLGGVAAGQNTFATRISVQAGDRIGTFSPIYALFCRTLNPGDQMAYIEGNSLPLGGFGTFQTAPGYQVPVVATIEPDVDRDGYGDETQDGCPQSAAYQTPCPVITINALTQAGAKAVTVFLATSLGAPVQITGSAKLGKGATANLKAATVGVVPGVIAQVRLQFPASLKKRLKELKPKQKLTLKVTASAANIAGPASSASASAKLKGQGK